VGVDGSLIGPFSVAGIVRRTGWKNSSNFISDIRASFSMEAGKVGLAKFGSKD
jgi:hypothetical protein